MNQEQRSQRRAAAKAFFDSLDQFEEVLQLSDSQSAQSPPQPSAASPSPPKIQQKNAFDLADLEAAAADIEEYFQSLPAESQQSKD